MRQLHVEKIVEAVAKMCIEANCNLNSDVYGAIENAKKIEESPIAEKILGDLIINADLAKQKQVPICQDTGMAVIFVELGQQLQIVGGGLNDAINEGVRQGYKNGYLRKSIVGDPLERINTKDNTPAIIHYDIVDGEGITITVAPKGFGSENMSRVYMLKPSDGIDGVKAAVLKTVDEAGSNPCPPMVIGVGIGGNFEKVAYLAKKALLRPIGSHSDKLHIRQLEEELYTKINQLGIGPQGFGGTTTALGINIETYPTHIAGLPLAINISCHVTRHVQVTL
jgi:fumarate hydratase subunit alpha